MWRNWRKAEKAALVLLMILAALSLLSSKVIYPAEPQPIYFAVGETNQVALTFETLWSSNNLGDILSILESEAIRATFFITGTWLKRHPDAARAILAGGHEIGNKTMSHQNLLALGQAEMEQEIESFNKLAVEELEYRPRLFRPPLGLYNGLVLRKAERHGCVTVLWSVESYDWISNSSPEIINRVKERVHGGAIIVFRVEAPLLLEALPVIITLLRQKGYEPVPASEMLRGR